MPREGRGMRAPGVARSFGGRHGAGVAESQCAVSEDSEQELVGLRRRWMEGDNGVKDEDGCIQMELLSRRPLSTWSFAPRRDRGPTPSRHNHYAQVVGRSPAASGRRWQVVRAPRGASGVVNRRRREKLELEEIGNSVLRLHELAAS